MLGWPCTLLKVSFLSAYNWLFKKFCNVISIKKWKLHFNHIARDWFFMCITACAFRAIGRCTFLEQSKTRTPDQWILLGRVQLILMTRHVLNTVTIAGVVTEQCEGVVKTAAPKHCNRHVSDGRGLWRVASSWNSAARRQRAHTLAHISNEYLFSTYVACSLKITHRLCWRQHRLFTANFPRKRKPQVHSHTASFSMRCYVTSYLKAVIKHNQSGCSIFFNA